ncbi:hypothetical protein RI543_000256 [Arxiozyma heterogenica]|uniref:Tethering factor for nuclear proteasome STS1 n=1 Tax=Arxiozyma heterogenica TaxID=278026 RepID=A0AAN8A9N1_9SACH|nr:hypothetical protein RI543_000256 [Kazachstania heterogenica]
MASGMGFSWGTSLLNANKGSTTTAITTTTTNITKPFMTTSSISTSNIKPNKRSFQSDADDESYSHDNNSTVNYITRSNIHSLKMPAAVTTTSTITTTTATKRKYTYNSTHQIMNNNSNCSGNYNNNNNSNGSGNSSSKCSLLISQNLPLPRSLNLLSKEQLCELIQNMIQEQPELTIPLQNNINQKLVSTVTIQDFINDLETKFNKIIKSIPYHKKYYDIDKLQPFNINCEYRIMDLDDYSFTRLKPCILDFLNCLIDYILFNLPPIIKNFIGSVELLDSITLMCLNLPRFKLPSNNYYYDKCWEQISFIWCSFINQLSNNSILLNINDNNNSILLNWFNKLNDYNQLTNGMLSRPLQLIRDVLLHNRNTNDYNLLSSLLQQQQEQQQQQQGTNKSFLSSAFITNNNHQIFTPIHNFTTINESHTTKNTLNGDNNKNNNYIHFNSTLENSNI